MASGVPKPIEEGRVACSAHEWAEMTLKCLSILPKDPQKNVKLWNFGIKEHAFPSGSNLDLEDYLRLRVLWNTWPHQRSIRYYMRDNRSLLNEERQGTPYRGYISPENDRVADAIYNSIKPKLESYLADIRRVNKGDGTRPSEDCGAFYDTRYWQGLVAVILKEVYDENGEKKVFKGKVRKSEAAAALLAVLGSSPVPRTPSEKGSSRQPQQGYGTPHLDASGASAGGLQNPATSDESFVNMALLLMLQTITRLIRIWVQDQQSQNSSRGRSASREDSQRSSNASTQASSSACSPAGSRSSSPATSRASSPTGNQGRDNDSKESSSTSASSLAQVHGLDCLDWLNTRLPLSLTDRHSGEKLMEARTDGYLCRRTFVQKQGAENTVFEPLFNDIPLAILEAKPFTRLSALSATRWQESAEIAAWVSGLDDDYENVGLLRSSRSGRKRRLLISQDRHELWIIIAEYGDEWRQYIRGRKMTRPDDFDQPQDVKDLAGSPGFVSLANTASGNRFGEMMRNANKIKNENSSTRGSRGRSLELPGPEYFCIMHQWGPYKTEDAGHMDFFIRRMIGLHVELVQNCPFGGLRDSDSD